jgi:hypothetical protein
MSLPNYQKVVNVLPRLIKRQKQPYNFFKIRQKYSYNFKKVFFSKKKKKSKIIFFFLKKNENLKFFFKFLISLKKKTNILI